MKTCRQFPGVKILTTLINDCTKLKAVAPQPIYILAFQGLQFT